MRPEDASETEEKVYTMVVRPAVSYETVTQAATKGQEVNEMRMLGSMYEMTQKDNNGMNIIIRKITRVLPEGKCIITITKKRLKFHGHGGKRNT